MTLFLARDITRLRGVHPDLVKVAALARQRTSFFVIEGLRTLEQQRANVARGASQTMRSRHLTGHAIDIAPWNDRNGNQIVENSEIDWNDRKAFMDLAAFMMVAATEMRVPLQWGGNFPGFPDGPHFELPWKDYPA